MIRAPESIQTIMIRFLETLQTIMIRFLETLQTIMSRLIRYATIPSLFFFLFKDIYVIIQVIPAQPLGHRAIYGYSIPIGGHEGTYRTVFLDFRLVNLFLYRFQPECD